MIDRRTFLAAGAVVGLVPSFVSAATASAGSADAALATLLQRHAELFLTRSPEQATNFGWDVGAQAALRSRLDDRSLAAMARDRQAIAAAQAGLRAIDRAALSPSALLDYDIAAFVYTQFADILGRYGYIDIDLRPSPYVVSQMNGTYYWLPDFIGSNHPLETAADVEAWYARLAAFAVALDQETERVRHDAGIGVIPPGFVIARTVDQLRQLRDAPVRQSALMAHAIARASAKGLGDVGARGEAIFAAQVAPALTRQIEALQALLPRASDIAGVWRLPNGDAYYAAAARSNTTVDTPPEELHRSGLAQCEELVAEIDRLMRAQGLASGTLGERLRAMDHDPRFLVSDDEAGRARLLAEAQRELDQIVALLPRAFNAPVVDPIVVRPVPAAIQDSAPGAFYNEGVGGGPGIYSINLKRSGDLPLWRLQTLTHHEGVPGHHFQFSMLRHAGGLSLYRRIVRFSAYTEGYALYAQQVADEIGAFDGNPFGRIGYLQSELFRAARIVVDTGIHHKRWTREQAVAWMVEHAGEQQTSTEREVMRYCVYPGQACSFKVGANSIVAAREAARTRLGARFDVRRFHDIVLRSGPMPMAVLTSAAARME
ncbi:DUF885 domain-containing protein [Flavisphingomonas formosensis]|uniref:DUF885 domain-containing protein n=1 Tax=Flavisphingomonas formosensis TaxID=861534 RepID=UPI0012F960DE|nr:DUF885 domain-containing protein [Sphingomonas formosensis]